MIGKHSILSTVNVFNLSIYFEFQFYIIRQKANAKKSYSSVFRTLSELELNVFKFKHVQLLILYN